MLRISTFKEDTLRSKPASSRTVQSAFAEPGCIFKLGHVPKGQPLVECGNTSKYEDDHPTQAEERTTSKSGPVALIFGVANFWLSEGSRKEGRDEIIKHDGQTAHHHHPDQT